MQASYRGQLSGCRADVTGSMRYDRNLVHKANMHATTQAVKNALFIPAVVFNYKLTVHKLIIQSFKFPSPFTLKNSPVQSFKNNEKQAHVSTKGLSLGVRRARYLR